MNARDSAIGAAIDLCIANMDPAWKAKYMELAFQYCLMTHEFHGSKLKPYMLKNGLWKPEKHNHWSGMLKVLARIGLIEKIGKVEPTDCPHAHIDRVSLWKSRIY